MFHFTNIFDYHQLLLQNAVSCEDAVTHYLAQINNNKDLNAYVHIFDDEAIARARELDNARQKAGIKGKLHGVVLSIKDVISYKGHPLTASSFMLKDFKAIYNATVIQRILDEGAIIIGTCNCDEFAMGSTNEHSFYGRVKNAIDPGKVSGGSSGGSAVAVQAGLCMASLGSDTGGSVRQPADFCGIVGFKPGYGRVSRYGLIAYASSFDQVGILSKNVEDVAAVLEVINGEDDYDATAIKGRSSISIKELPYKNIRIGILQNALDQKSLDAEIGEKISNLARSLEEKGADIKPAELKLIDYVVPAYYVLTTAEASSNLSRYDGVRYGYRCPDQFDDIESFYKANRSAGFGPEVKKRIMLGTFVLSEGYFDAYFSRAQKIRKMLLDEAKELFNNFDFLLLPTVPQTAFDAGMGKKDPLSLYLADIFTVYANLTGIPAISLPLFQHSNGMPFGLQILANAHNEVNLLSFSNSILNDFRHS